MFSNATTLVPSSWPFPPSLKNSSSWKVCHISFPRLLRDIVVLFASTSPSHQFVPRRRAAVLARQVELSCSWIFPISCVGIENKPCSRVHFSSRHRVHQFTCDRIHVMTRPGIYSGSRCGVHIEPRLRIDMVVRVRVQIGPGCAVNEISRPRIDQQLIIIHPIASSCVDVVVRGVDIKVGARAGG